MLAVLMMWPRHAGSALQPPASWGEQAHAMHHAPQVHTQHPFPVFDGVLPHQATSAHTGVVERRWGRQSAAAHQRPVAPSGRRSTHRPCGPTPGACGLHLGSGGVQRVLLHIHQHRVSCPGAPMRAHSSPKPEHCAGQHRRLASKVVESCFISLGLLLDVPLKGTAAPCFSQQPSSARIRCAESAHAPCPGAGRYGAGCSGCRVAASSSPVGYFGAEALGSNLHLAAQCNAVLVPKNIVQQRHGFGPAATVIASAAAEFFRCAPGPVPRCGPSTPARRGWRQNAVHQRHHTAGEPQRVVGGKVGHARLGAEEKSCSSPCAQCAAGMSERP